jgi:hypothetical protein
MAKFSKKVMGKEVGDAKVYAEPHTMDGKTMKSNTSETPYNITKAAKDVNLKDPAPNGVSFGQSGEPKTSGIKMRGTGCATKGTMSRGPMA